MVSGETGFDFARPEGNVGLEPYGGTRNNAQE